MKLKITEKYEAVVIEIKGNVMGGPEASEFSDSLRELLNDGKNKIILDLGDVKFMNSSGLGMLIAGLTTITNAGGKLKLAAVGDKIQSLLMITKLITIFEHYETLEQALDSFKS